MALTEEEVVGVGAFAADPKQLEEVPELAMDVAADLVGVWNVSVQLSSRGRQSKRGGGACRDGRVDPLDVCLLDEDFASLEAEVLDLLFRDGLAVCVCRKSGVRVSRARCRRGVEGRGRRRRRTNSSAARSGCGLGEQGVSSSRVIQGEARAHRSRLEAIGRGRARLQERDEQPAS